MVQKWAYLRAWNWMYNATEETIQAKIRKAEEENAPEDAIYRGPRGVWVTLRDISSPTLKYEVWIRANGKAKDTSE